MKFNNAKRKLLVLAAAATLPWALGLPAQAADYPTRTITWVVPFPPSGAMDVIARTLGEQMSKELGQAVVIENRPGAGGNIGASHVAHSKPDGYTIMIAANGMAVNPSLYKSLNYDPIKDFEPVSLLAYVPNILVTQASRKDVNTVADVLALAKANPDKYTFASAGVGTSIHLAGELFNSLGHIKMMHVPYKGSGPAMTDLLGGQVDFMFDSITSAKPHIQSGKLKAIAVTTSKRSATLPDVPTVAESGLPGYDLTPWFATFVPAGTPPDIVARLNKSMLDAMKTPKVQATFSTIGAEAVGSSPAELKTYLASEESKWSRIIKEAGIQAN
ncbi:tripartite tricarboxylate transporter substrate binding protein [Paralcaligenes sp. KSB-10]|uniref:Bug family tripartite tricarboxylate transporter substrate binding protein n=1 Tax=Paralcaligenes sp. KSB-10 TaxID=2901142 RepID=UPI001E2FDAF2|nr:tripartite tricarboxylate transporter substrate binding protein [Paralcaligenes sp. KSB-10]UHL63678.1 tripartite tricarboxylate transporter substrate binding protein [Paralcaligenes sp. KSB-10]